LHDDVGVIRAFLPVEVGDADGRNVTLEFSAR
jgi:hypothetical protein